MRFSCGAFAGEGSPDLRRQGALPDDGRGYIVGYNVVGARRMAGYAEAPISRRDSCGGAQGRRDGRHRSKAVAAYLNKKFGFTEAEVESQHAVMERCSSWTISSLPTSATKMLAAARRIAECAVRSCKWVWPDGLKSIDPSSSPPLRRRVEPDAADVRVADRLGRGSGICDAAQSAQR